MVEIEETEDIEVDVDVRGRRRLFEMGVGVHGEGGGLQWQQGTENVIVTLGAQGQVQVHTCSADVVSNGERGTSRGV